MSVSVSKVGHLVLRVRELDRSLTFYCGIPGLREVARRDQPSETVIGPSSR